jgi:hypothetical protein
VLEESWRRTYYMLHVTEQHFAIQSMSPIHTLTAVSNKVDLPCDDEYFESGQIPPVRTWQAYESREFEEVEIVFSSMTYLWDVERVVGAIMRMFLETGKSAPTSLPHRPADGSFIQVLLGKIRLK